MGRAKLKMELISKEKSRNITFKKRKEGLVRKMHEFTTLCDVSAAMIIFGPASDSAPDIWPPDPAEVCRIINIYKAKGRDSGNKTFGLTNFFLDRKRKIEEELAKLRKKNMEAKYPTWPEFLNNLPEHQLREFAAALGGKAEYVRSRVELLRRNQESLNLDMSVMLSQSHLSFYTPAGISGLEFDVFNQQAVSAVKPALEMHLPAATTAMDHHHNPMMMLLMNDADHFAGPSSGGNIQSATTSYKRQVFSGAAAVDHQVFCPSPKALARYYPSPVMPPVPSFVMPPPPPPPPPPLQFWGRTESREEDAAAGGSFR